MRLNTLKRRSEFQRIRGGGRWSGAAFVLECKERAPADPPAVAGDHPRFGFTVTKKIGGAVVRNRARRRLKSAVESQATGHSRPGFDYVIIARAAAVDRPFAALQQDVVAAFARVHAPQRPGMRKGQARPASD